MADTDNEHEEKDVPIGQFLDRLKSKIAKAFKDVLFAIPNFVLSIIKCAFTFALVTFGWIFFRANTVSDAFYITAHLFDNISSWTSLQYLYTTATGLGLNVAELFVVGGSILLLVVLELISGKKQVFDYFRQKPYIINVGFMTALAVIILTTGVFYNAGEFIYFQF